MDEASVNEDRKSKVSALTKWIMSNTKDINSKTGKTYAKKLYDTGVPQVEKLVKKLKKNPAYLTEKVEFDADDALELKAALSKAFNVSFTTSEVVAEADAIEGDAASLVAPSKEARYANLVDPSIISSDRKEKTDAMIDWFKTNSADITAPNIILYSFRLYEDNCATISRMASKMERNNEYLSSLGFDADDIFEIVCQLKNIGLLKPTFLLPGELHPAAAGSSSSKADNNSFVTTKEHATAVKAADAAEANSSTHVRMLDVFSSLHAPFDPPFGPEVVGLLVGIYSEETKDWLEGCIVNYSLDSKCHDVRFVDDFELDVDLSTHRIRIEECEETFRRVPNKRITLQARSRFVVHL